MANAADRAAGQRTRISRGSVYYLPWPTPNADLALMRRIDKLHLEYPFAGSRMLQGLLKAEGHEAGRLHVSTLMKKMAIEALYRRPRTSKPAPGHGICPYLLRKMAVTRPNQVWAMDITYLPLLRGFVYLAGRPRLVQPESSGQAAVNHAVRGGSGRASPASDRGGAGTRAVSMSAGDATPVCVEVVVSGNVIRAGADADETHLAHVIRAARAASA